LPTTSLLQERIETPEPPAIVVGLKEQDKLVEFVPTDSVTGLANPLIGETLTLDVPEVDTSTLNVEGLVVILKS
jgi:hypothetical protein